MTEELEEALRTRIRQLKVEVSDLRIHLRDRDAYIRTLETERKELLQREVVQHEQEALL